MANSIRGKILAIEPIQEIPSKKPGQTPFRTRRLLLDATRYDGLTGERGPENFVMFEFGGEKDVLVPDSFKKGDVVEVFFRLRGIKYQKQGETKPQYFVHVAGYKIEKIAIGGNVQGQSSQTTVQPQANTVQPQHSAQQAQGTQKADDNMPF